ncbi:MAG: prepilin-type N-terminal cleavage/methylation domain-containing protein [Elusimicrobiaceae bacterium]|nr:prepilin-type N-terminal cleavage/methylation domain-containing protein [Elusimicrobiaceae bacterium]
MLSKGQGFTLIELLIVVLIITVLVAVAVPQYQKAVIKSRIFGYMPFVKSLVQAQEAYYLANGRYATYFEDLDVDFPKSCKLQDNKYKNMIYCNDSIIIDNGMAYSLPIGDIAIKYCPKGASLREDCSNKRRLVIRFYLRHADAESMQGKMRCESPADNLAKQICDAFNAQYRKN